MKKERERERLLFGTDEFISHSSVRLAVGLREGHANEVIVSVVESKRVKKVRSNIR